VAERWTSYEAGRFVDTHGSEGVASRRPFARSTRLPTRVDPLPEAVAAEVAAQVAFADIREQSRGPIADALIAPAALEASFGRLPEAAALADRVLAADCRSGSGFEAFRLRVELARATRDAATLAALRDRHLDPARTCARDAAERRAGTSLFR